MKKNKLTNLDSRKKNTKKTDSGNAEITFKGGLRNIILKYALSHSAYIPLDKWCETALAGLAGIWAETRPESTADILDEQPPAVADIESGIVIACAAASYGAAVNVQHSVLTHIERKDANAVYDNPAGNPYDMILGRRHNQLLKFMIIDNPSDGPADARMLYSNIALPETENAFFELYQHEVANLYLYFKSSATIRSLRNLLAYNVGDSDLLYVMNAYIYGITNAISLSDALCVTYDFESYITNNSALTALQRDILLQGFAVAKYSFNFWKQN